MGSMLPYIYIAYMDPMGLDRRTTVKTSESHIQIILQGDWFSWFSSTWATSLSVSWWFLSAALKTGVSPQQLLGSWQRPGWPDLHLDSTRRRWSWTKTEEIDGNSNVSWSISNNHTHFPARIILIRRSPWQGLPPIVFHRPSPHRFQGGTPRSPGCLRFWDTLGKKIGYAPILISHGNGTSKLFMDNHL